MGFFPYMGGILWGFLTFMEGFPIPPLSRGRSGGGWGIYVALVLNKWPNKNKRGNQSFGVNSDGIGKDIP